MAESSCASEGTVEVLIEPQLPQPLLAVVGDSPAAVTLRDLAAAIGWSVTTDLAAGAEAVVVATMGRGDAEALDAALATPAGYIGLVASAKRAGVELAALRERGLDEETLARVRSPAGLDLGPLTQPEIAVAVLAELVAWRHDRGPLGELPVEAVDPVCGMTVAVGQRHADGSSTRERRTGSAARAAAAGSRATPRSSSPPPDRAARLRGKPRRGSGTVVD